MDITYYGQSCFRLRGKQASIVTDPFDPDVTGIKYPRNVEADIVTVSHDHKDHSAADEIGGSPYVVHGPGEYEIKGISVIGVPVFHDDKEGAERGKVTAYHIEIDELKIVHLGDIGHPLTSAQSDALDGVDILMVPVGGFSTVDARTAAMIVADMSPQIVIPMHYAREDSAKDIQEHFAPVSEFLKALSKESVPPVPKLSVTKDKLPLEMQVVIFE